MRRSTSLDAVISPAGVRAEEIDALGTVLLGQWGHNVFQFLNGIFFRHAVHLHLIFRALAQVQYTKTLGKKQRKQRKPPRRVIIVFSHAGGVAF